MTKKTAVGADEPDDNSWDRIWKMVEAYEKVQSHVPSHVPSYCPHCHSCPTCGRPYQYRGWWQNPVISYVTGSQTTNTLALRTVN